MIKKQTALYFAEQAYHMCICYGKRQGTFMRGLCFYNVDYKNKVVDLGFSTEEGLFVFSLPIRKSWM